MLHFSWRALGRTLLRRHDTSICWVGTIQDLYMPQRLYEEGGHSRRTKTQRSSLECSEQ